MQKLVWENSLGDKVDLTSGNYGITEWEGFSNASLNIQSQQVPFQDGAVFLDALLNQRELSVTLKMQDNGNLEERYRMRRELIHVLNPKLGEGYLIYTNDFTSKRIKCVPQIPLFKTHNSNDSGTPEASLAWTACEPYWEDIEERNITIGVSGITNIENNGDIPAQLKIKYSTGFARNPRLTNVTQNTFIEYEGILNNVLHIDTNFGKKSATKESINFNVENVSNIINSVLYCKTIKKFIAIGDSYTYALSEDGINWEYYKTDIRYLSALCYSESLNIIVAVGSSGSIITSDDGINWTSRESGITEGLTSVIFVTELNYFVAVGANSKILKSYDGVTWTDISYNGGNYILSKIKYFKDYGFYIVGREELPAGNKGVILKSVDCTDWTSQIVERESFNDITYSLNTFILVGVHIYKSYDGNSWIDCESEFTNVDEVFYNNEYKTFIGINKKSIIRSKTGDSWGLVFNDNDVVFRCITYSNELKIFIADGTYCYTSFDLINWNLNNSKIAYTTKCITDGKKIIAINSISSFYQNPYYISLDSAKTFSKYYFISTENKQRPEDIIYIKKLNIFVCCSSTTVCISEDGINWQEKYVNNNMDFRSLYYDTILNKLFVCSLNSDGVVSEDFENWNVVPYLDGNICRGGNLLLRYVYKSVYISTDGEHWESYEYIFENSVKQIIYNSELKLFIGVSGGYIIKSEDGINWQKEYSSLFEDVSKIAYIEKFGMFIAIGRNGTILTSYDAISWNNKSLNINLWLTSVVYDDINDKIIIMGESGIIVISNYSNKENQIQNITKDSDMNLNLSVGINTFRVNCEEGSMTVNITYRQKYIGV